MSKAVLKGIEQLKAENERLQAEAAALREALGMAVEAIANSDAEFCGETVRKANAALAPDAGRALLERLRLAERERDEARAAFDALAKIDAIGKAAEIAAERER